MNDALKIGVLDFGPASFSVTVAKYVERLGYHRYWITEHHGEDAGGKAEIGSPAVLAAVLASRTERLRIGAGGVMILVHSPLRLAEDFRLLELMFPGRIDLGTVPAVPEPRSLDLLLDGKPPRTAAKDGPERLKTLCSLVLGEPCEGMPQQAIHVPPTGVTSTPALWVLSGSPAAARLAAEMGLRFGAGEHVVARRNEPVAAVVEAIETYHRYFRPSAELSSPECAVAFTGIIADTKEHAERLLAGRPRPCLFGEFERCRDEIAKRRELYGNIEMLFADGCLTLDDKLRSYRLFAEATSVAPRT